MRIPQKKSAFDAPSSAPTSHLDLVDKVAFGIEASYLPSHLFFLVYHVAFLLSGFGFWAYWIRHHPDDLQNASVPLFTVIMLIGSFWTLFGKRLGIP